MKLKETIKKMINNHFQFDWHNILNEDKESWRQFKEKAKNGPKILIATSTGGHEAVTPIESLLAIALTLRGANVHFLLCDKYLPACLMATTSGAMDTKEFSCYGPQKKLCDRCFSDGYKLYISTGLPIHLYSNFVSIDEENTAREIAKKISNSEITKFKYDGIKIGEHSIAGALRYFARADFSGEPYSLVIIKRYFQAGLLSYFALKRLLSQYKYYAAVLHHGIYIPQGIIGEIMRRNGVDIITWAPAYRKKCFIFSHNDTYHHTLISEPKNKWESLKMSNKMKNALSVYLKSRWKGTNDWIWFHEKPSFDVSAHIKKMGIDISKPCIGLLTNVMWDAQLHYPANAFPDMLSWLIETIRYFKTKKDLQLIIRIHPAELRGTIPSRQRVADEIKKSFPQLPGNIFIISPDSEVSTYALMQLCNSVLIYGTKTGVELTSMGIPVIVAGEAWIKNKGITYDAKNRQEYFKILDQLPFADKLTKRISDRARKYAYHFFFRRMIPISFANPRKNWPPYYIKIKYLRNLLPKADAGLDVICNGILQGKDFIYSAEKFT